MERVAFIINPFSAKKEYKPFVNDLEKRVEKPFYLISKSIEDTFSFMENNMDKVDIFVAVGGDGTISTVAQKLINTDKILGIFPAGSGNGFANENHFSKNIDTLLSKIKNRKHREIDTFTINNKLSINLSGAGFDGEVAKNFEKTSRGFANYIKTSISTFFKFKPINISFEEKYKSYNGEYLMMNLANTRQFGNNAYIAPQASMSDGLLDVIIMEPFDLLDAPQISLDMFNKTLDKNSKIKTFRCKELKIHRKNEGVIHFDGDPVEAGKDIVVSLKEKGIKVIVNPDADKSLREPNAFQSIAASLFNDLNDMRRVLNKRSQKLGKVIQRKLTR